MELLYDDDDLVVLDRLWNPWYDEESHETFDEDIDTLAKFMEPTTCT